MRIGFVGLITIGGASTGTAGGVEKLIEEVSTRLANNGHDVTVYVRARYNASRSTRFGKVRLRNLPAIYTKHLEAITHSFLSTCCALAECDVVHFHSMGPALLSFIPRLVGRKTVCTLHGIDWKRDKWGRLAKLVLRLGEQCALRFPNRTTVVSRFMERYYPEHYRKPVSYIPNGVPPIPHRPLNALRRFGIEPNRYILYLSRIVPEKGLQYLIPAFRALDTDFNLLIVGDARHADAHLEKMKALAGDDPRIVFTGPLYGDEKEEAYSNAYLFCLPSDIEGLPIVLLEAMGAGRCCLTSDVPELAEIIDPPKYGYPDIDPQRTPAPHGVTFRQGSIDDLRNTLATLLSAPERVAALGQNSQTYARLVYDWDAVAAQYEQMYRELMGGSRRHD